MYISGVTLFVKLISKMLTVKFMPPLTIVPPAPKESLRKWRTSYETTSVVFGVEHAIALLPSYCNRNDAERAAARDVAKTFTKGSLKVLWVFDFSEILIGWKQMCQSNVSITC